MIPFGNPLLNLAHNFLTLLNILLPVTSLMAVLAFFYGLAKFIWNSGDTKKIQEGKGIMTWGVVAMFVLVTIWGIIGFMQASIGNQAGPWGEQQINLPAVHLQ